MKKNITESLKDTAIAIADYTSAIVALIEER